MNVMILGTKPSAMPVRECPSHAELFERIARIEKCLAKIEKALAADMKGRKAAAPKSGSARPKSTTQTK